jgi:hypothetical protein
MTPRERHDMKYIVATAGVVILAVLLLVGWRGQAVRTMHLSLRPINRVRALYLRPFWTRCVREKPLPLRPGNGF